MEASLIVVPSYGDECIDQLASAVTEIFVSALPVPSLEAHILRCGQIIDRQYNALLHITASRRIDGQRVVANRQRPDQVVSCAIRFNSLGKICVDVGDGKRSLPAYSRLPD